MRKLITCPERGVLVEIEARESSIDGRITRITYCSLWKRDPGIDCRELCAKRMNRKVLADKKAS
jgi:hypothetical protein